MGSLKDRVNKVIEDNFDRPFVWGEWDCTIFCFECCVPDQTDIIRGKYDDAKGAFQMVEDLGGYDSKIRELGGTRIPVSYLRTGDLVMLCPDDIDYGVDEPRNTVGIFQSREIVCVTLKGMKRYPKHLAKLAWRFE